MWYLYPRVQSSCAMDDRISRPTNYCNVAPSPSVIDSLLQILMMCGLPGSGKTQWVRNFLKRNSQECFTVLGTDFIINKMEVILNAHFMFF